MTTHIKQADLIETIAGALQYISYYHPADYIAHLARAYEAEKSPAAKDAIAQILTNSRMSATGHRPICQDTGIVNVFLKIGRCPVALMRLLVKICAIASFAAGLFSASYARARWAM